MKTARRPSASRHRIRPGTVSPTRDVPASIPRPDYAMFGGVPLRSSEPLVRTESEIARMRAAGRAAAEVLAEVLAAVEPGISTDELDRIGHAATIARGAYPSTLGYAGRAGHIPFPKSLCTSVNEVVCHGIPDSTLLTKGDTLNVDVTVYLDGVHGDTDASVPVGAVDPETARLLTVTREATRRGIATLRHGAALREVGRAVDNYVREQGFSVVSTYGGHAIGTLFHGGMHVPHVEADTTTEVLRRGMTLTVEPIVSAGTPRHKQWRDGWTEVTRDLSRTAQFEHTLLITDDGAEILTHCGTDPVGDGWPCAEVAVPA